jgi:hypothetical protein
LKQAGLTGLENQLKPGNGQIANIDLDGLEK